VIKNSKMDFHLVARPFSHGQISRGLQLTIKYISSGLRADVEAEVRV
jgi:hypothetical protein